MKSKSINKSWNKRVTQSPPTSLEKRNLLRVWINLWAERLNIILSDDDVEAIYYDNVINVDKIFFPNTLFLVEKYLKENKNIKLEYDINSF